MRFQLELRGKGNKSRIQAVHFGAEKVSRSEVAFKVLVISEILKSNILPVANETSFVIVLAVVIEVFFGKEGFLAKVAGGMGLDVALLVTIFIVQSQFLRAVEHLLAEKDFVVFEANFTILKVVSSFDVVRQLL